MMNMIHCGLRCDDDDESRGDSVIGLECREISQCASQKSVPRVPRLSSRRGCMHITIGSHPRSGWGDERTCDGV